MPNAKTATADSGGRPLAVLAVQVAALAVSVALVLQLAFGVVGIRYVYGYIPDFASPTLIVEALRRAAAIVVFVWLAFALRRAAHLGRLAGIACISLLCAYCIRAWLTAPVDVPAAASVAIVTAIFALAAYWLYTFGFSPSAKEFFRVPH